MQPKNWRSLKTFSPQSLAARLEVEPARLQRLLAESPIPNFEAEGNDPRIPESALDALFQAFAASEGIRIPSYELPEDWDDPPSLWEAELARMYRHACAYPACLPPSQGRQLRELVIERNPRTVLEIGSFIGVSLIWIASALEALGSDGRVHAVDLFDPIWPWPPFRYSYLRDPLAFAQKAAKDAGLSHRIIFHRMNSFDLANHFSEVTRDRVDFAFLDGDHSISGCMHDFFSICPRVNLGGTILLHDTNPEICGHDGPRHLLDRLILPSPHYRVTEIETRPQNYGMAAIEKIADDPRLGTARNNLKLRLIRLHAWLAGSSLWQAVRNTSFGRLLRGTVRKWL